MRSTVYSNIEFILGGYEFYQSYCKGLIPAEEYYKYLDKNKIEIMNKGISEWLFNTIKKIPLDDKCHLSMLLSKLKENNVLQSIEYDDSSYDKLHALIRNNFDHGNYATYIFPEEERIAYGVAKLLKPENIFVAGSFYGYWAIWMFQGLAAGGKAILSDIDPEAVKLANKNLNAFGFASSGCAICKDAEEMLRENDTPIDLLVIDATGDKNDPRPEYQGKSIYGPFAKASLHRLKSGSIVLAHNIERKSSALDAFFEIIDPISKLVIELETTCGVGVYVIR